MDSCLKPRAGISVLTVYVLISLGSAQAELFYFKEGGRFRAPCEIKGETVLIDLPGGIRKCDRSAFVQIVPGHSPSKEWTDRRAEAFKGSPAEQRKAVQWAIEKGLSLEALDFLTSLKEVTDPALARLQTVANQLDKSLLPSTDRANKFSLGTGFTELKGKHLLLLHKHPETEAAERLDVLERVFVAFYLLWTELGIDLKIPTELQVSAWYAESREFVAFLDRENAGAFRKSKGYFHPTRMLVVALDSRSDEAHLKALKAIQTLKAQSEELETAISRVPRGATIRIERAGEPARSLNKAGLTKERDRVVAELARRSLLLDLQWRELEYGTAAHELVHLLTVSSGLASRFDHFPKWLHEGLATQFENVAGGRWAGFGHPHEIRLPDYHALTPPPRLAPLVKDAGLTEGYRRDPYAATWSFVNYLLTERRAEFVVFLDSLRHEPTPQRTRNDRLREAFHDDLPPLEAAWHAFARAQKTELETETPVRNRPDRR